MRKEKRVTSHHWTNEKFNEVANEKRVEGEIQYKSPVYSVIAVPIEKIVANDYNPNKVATREMKLLYLSIASDGYTMPVVCYHDKENDKYILVDGFHRYRVMLECPDIYKRENGCLPVSVIDKPLEYRIASTIRHNRARGKHGVELQANVVEILSSKWDSEKISKELGMSLEEVRRLAGILGIGSEVEGLEYSKKLNIEQYEVDGKEDE